MNLFEKVRNLILGVLFLFFAASVYAQEKPIINRFVIFGDSLSDTGRMLKNSLQFLPSKENYWQGRFSNGFTWVDYLAQSYGTTVLDEDFILNQSMGGMTSYPYSQEIQKKIISDLFNLPKYFQKLDVAFMSNLPFEIWNIKNLKNKKFTPNDLVLIWLGANDILWVGQSYDDSLDIESVVKQAAQQVYDSIEKLIVEDGVKNIVLGGIPDMDLAPRYLNNPEKSKYIKTYNLLLIEAIQELKKYTPNIYFADADFIYKEKIIPHYLKYGFNDYQNKVIDAPYVDFKLPLFINPTEFSVFTGGDDLNVFWDEVHPTTKSHALIASILKKEVVDKYFQIELPKSQCVLVEVRNSGTFVLGVDVVNNKDACGFKYKALVPGDTGLFSVKKGTQFSFVPWKGVSSKITIPDEDTFVRRAYPETDIETLVPYLKRVTCSGSVYNEISCVKLNF